MKPASGINSSHPARARGEQIACQWHPPYGKAAHPSGFSWHDLFCTGLAVNRLRANGTSRSAISMPRSVFLAPAACASVPAPRCVPDMRQLAVGGRPCELRLPSDCLGFGRSRRKANLVALRAGFDDCLLRGFALGGFLCDGHLLLGETGQLTDRHIVALAQCRIRRLVQPFVGFLQFRRCQRCGLGVGACAAVDAARLPGAARILQCVRGALRLG